MLEAIQHSEFEEAISSDDALCQEESHEVRLWYSSEGLHMSM